MLRFRIFNLANKPQHIATKHPELCCNICGTAFKSPALLSVHLASSTHPCCPHCDIGFQTPDELQEMGSASVGVYLHSLAVAYILPSPSQFHSALSLARNRGSRRSFTRRVFGLWPRESICHHQPQGYVSRTLCIDTGSRDCFGSSRRSMSGGSSIGAISY